MKLLYSKYKVFLILLILFIPVQSYAKTAIIITIDGLRPDAISEKTSPNLFYLMKRSSYTLKARTVFPSLTIPSHTSLLSGLDVKNHNIRFNQWEIGQEPFKNTTIFTILDGNNLSYSFVCGKRKLLFLLEKTGDNTVNCYEVDIDRKDIERNVALFFLDDFKKREPSLSFVHFPEPDKSGHETGWLSDKYISALTKVDKEIGNIVGYMEDNNFKDFLMIITSDHGGHSTTHGTKDDIDMTIPWIAFGDTIKENYVIGKQVFIYDTTPTVLQFLNLKIPTGLDGKPVKEIFN
jgi:predicted AlkP superfamily pyrophosphatase or phosphodiesterase